MSDNEGESNRALMPKFGGQKAKFQEWCERWYGYASVCGWDDALEEDFAKKLPDSQHEDLDEVADKAKIKAKMKNLKAMASFSMALNTAAALSTISGAKSKEWPRGLAYKAMKLLRDRYLPDDEFSEMEADREMRKVKMREKQDPTVLFEQLRTIQARYAMSTSVDVSDRDIEKVVLQKIPMAYRHITSAWLEIPKAKKPPGIIALEKKLHNHWRNIYGVPMDGKDTDASDDDEEGEVGLSNFQGFCRKCKKKGHKASECRSGGGGGNKKPQFKGKCNTCGKNGHQSQDCWERPENANKRPANYKPKGGTTVSNSAPPSTPNPRYSETSAVAVDNNPPNGHGGPEYVLTSTEDDNSEVPMTFPAAKQLLFGPDIWVADSGATTHTTSHLLGCYDVRDASKGDLVTGHTGVAVKTTKLASINIRDRK